MYFHLFDSYLSRLLHGSQFCHGEGAWLTQWSCEPCLAGPPLMDESKWSVLTKCGSLEKEMTIHTSIFATRTPWTVWKVKKVLHRNWAPQVGRWMRWYWGRLGAITISTRKNKLAGTKWKWHSVVDVSGSESKV